ncbi:hypothetical protein Emag_001915 [Eimeria magna]
MFAICPPTATSSVAEGLQRRRLAEGGAQEYDDLTPPSTPEVLDLCLEIESQLSPLDSPPEALRASPVMVQAFLDELAGGKDSESGVGPAYLLHTFLEESQKLPGSLLKRPAPGDADDDGEVAGPASKVAKKDTTLLPHSSYASWETHKSSQSSTGSIESDGFESFVASSSPELLSDFPNLLLLMSEIPDAPPVPPSVSFDASPSPSSAVVGPGPSSALSGDKTVHPWLHVPALKPDVGALKFRAEKMSEPLFSHHHGRIMAKMRELLVQPELDREMAIRLLVNSEALVNHAFHKMRAPVSSRRPTDTAESLGRRFMMFHLLHLASKALQQPWPQQQWWTDLASAIPTACPFAPGGEGLISSSEASVALAVQLSAALELYKIGSAPDNDEVVDIMRKLFCSRESPHHFKTALWDPWRRDDDPSSSST